jgi:hypothetical protein
MHKLATTALAVAMGLAWSALPAAGSGTTTTEDKSVKEKAADLWDKTKQKTSETWDKTKEKTSEAWDKTKEKTSDAWDKTKEKTSEAKDKVKGNGRTAGEKTDRGLEKTKAKAAELKDKAKAALGPSGDIRQAQEALRAQGHDPGPVDGIMGPRTASALREYQKKENLKVTGRLDSETKDRLVAGKPSSTPAASPATGTSTGSPSAPAQLPEKTQKQ